MRLQISILPALAILAAAASEPADTHQHKLSTVEDALAEPKADSAAEPLSGGQNGTVFNGIEVPPMVELSGESVADQIKSGYWFIKHFSPFCHHCQEIAPTWQTLYEFYSTSRPVPGNDPKKTPLNSFTNYYDFHFASLDCIAFGDACADHDIEAFPTFQLYKNSKFVKKFTDAKNITMLSKFIEEALETIRPGSRPANGVNLPKPGASSVDTTAEPEVPAAKDKDPKAGAAAASAHMAAVAAAPSVLGTSRVSAKPAVPAYGTTNKKKKPSGPANPVGTSVALNKESFMKLVTTTQDPWFIKFYAPWCPHCQALAPSWLQMAKELQGKLNIGEVNCDMESRLCKDVHVKAYPTIHFFRGGEKVEYDGLRGLGDLVSFAKKALDVGLGVPEVDEAAFKRLEETEEVIFVYFYDHATTSEDFEALERLPLSLVGHARLVKTNDKALAKRFKVSNWPRLLVSRDGRADYYEALAPKDMRDFRQVLPWMRKVWMPIVPELTASNSREIMRGKYVVLGVLSRERQEEFLLDKREIKNAALEWMEKQRHAFELERQELRDAKQLRLEEAEDRNDDRAKRAAKSIQIGLREDDKKQVGFAWVDGVFWERWIRTTYGVNVKEGERVIINDEDNRRYWDTTISGAWITPSRTSIMETIPKVIASPPKIPSKSTIGVIKRFFFFMTGTLTSHPILSVIFLSVVGALLWSQYNSNRSMLGRRRGISLAGAESGYAGKHAGAGGAGKPGAGWIGSAEKMIGNLLDEKASNTTNGKAD